jgi:mRNA interferase RelE/StbE
MKVSYTRQFVNDVEKYHQLKRKVLDVTQTFKNAKTLSELKNIKKLKSAGNEFRVKTGSFRIGFTFADNTILFKRFLHRIDIYLFFP